MTIHIRNNQQSDPTEWLFFLTNVRLLTGDFKSSFKKGEPAYDGIKFTTIGREWHLWDTMKVERKDKTVDIKKPLVSGILKIPYLDGDTEEEIAEVVDDIGFILSIAMSRTVSWISYSILDSNGTKIQGNARESRVTAFNLKRFEPITNWSSGSLKQLLERSLPVILADREWYRRTLDILLQAQLADYYEIRCHLLYTLAERIATKAVVKSGEAEIDPDLKSRARKKDFVKQLHNILKELSPENWKQDHTDNLLSELKRWNRMPTFVKKIQRACKTLKLAEPDKDLLEPRNVLLHDGELNIEEGENYEHYLELDHIVLTMTLRLLEYEGEYYHPNSGDSPVPIIARSITE